MERLAIQRLTNKHHRQREEQDKGPEASEFGAEGKQGAHVAATVNMRE